MPLLIICCVVYQNTDKSVCATCHSIPAAIASHIHFLASDALEGRETGMRGFEVAAEYVRAQFIRPSDCSAATTTGSSISRCGGHARRRRNRRCDHWNCARTYSAATSNPRHAGLAAFERIAARK